MSGRRRDGGPAFKHHWIIVGHVSYIVLSDWYCCASEGMLKYITNVTVCLYMADIVSDIGVDASFISVFIGPFKHKYQNVASWCNRKSYS